MARSRRRMVRATRPRRRADWVYRANATEAGEGAAGGNTDVLGSYDPFIPAHQAGPGNAQGHILYDSQNYTSQLLRPQFGNVTKALSRAGRAEGRKPTMLAVEGIIYWEPATWALGNLMAIGMRIGVFEQDTGSGNLLLDAAYSMWVEEPAAAGSSLTVPADWANNGRGNAWERRVHYGFSDNAVFTVTRIKWRGRRTLNANECFAIYTELEPTSVNTRTQWWLRTLVSDEG